MLRALLIASFALSCFAQTGAAPAPAREDAHSALADVLLPETRSWRSIDSFPHPSLGELDGLFDALIAKISKHVENDAVCSFPERARRRPGFLTTLHQGDIFGPADDDMVYAGSMECGDGDFTIVWRHVHEPSRMAAVVIFAEVLRIDSAGKWFTEIERGCCAEQTDHYRIADLTGVHHRAVGVFKGLSIPAGSRPSGGRVQLAVDDDPTIHLWPPDTVHPDGLPETDEDGGAMTFPVGASGELLRTYRDPTGRLWRLVEIGDKSASDAGWILERRVPGSEGSAR